MRYRKRKEWPYHSSKAKGRGCFRGKNVCKRSFLVLPAFILSLSLALSLACFGFLSRAQAREEAMYTYHTSYEIQYGDSLWELASSSYEESRYESGEAYLNEILRLNRMLDPEELQVGSYLILPYQSAELLP